MRGEIEIRLENGARMLFVGDVDVAFSYLDEEREKSPFRSMGYGDNKETVRVNTATVTTNWEERR